MAMTNMRIIENLELDHLDFAESCALVGCLAAALEAMAAYSSDGSQMDRLALIHATAMRRKHTAFVERESKREAFAESESKRAEAEA